MPLPNQREDGSAGAARERGTEIDGLSAPLPRALLVISLAGLLDASYLSWVHLSTSKSCIAGNGCSTVLGSPHALLFGIPVAALGAGMYLALALFSLRLLRAPERCPECGQWLFAISLAGVAASAHFTALQAFVIRSWCPFCLLSAGMTVLFFVLCTVYCRKTGHLKALGSNPARLLRRGLPAAVMALSLPPLLVLAGEKALDAAGREADDGERRVVAVMGERPVTLAEVDAAIQLELQQIEMQRYEQRLEYLKNRLVEMEADLRGTTLAQLLQEEVAAGITVGPDEIQQFIDANAGRLPKLPLPVLRERIEKLLRDRKFEAARETYVAGLQEKHQVRFSLPLPPRIAIDPNPRGGPQKGPADAPVTIVEFSDFECPFCGKTHQALEALVERHPGQIRLVFRHLPLKMHPMAREIAEFSVCVHRQGLFWPFADKVFAQRRQWTAGDLTAIAREVGVDEALLARCTRSGAGAEAVDLDLAEGDRWGLHSTPSLFINGRYFAGMPKNLDAVIEEELAARRP